MSIAGEYASPPLKAVGESLCRASPGYLCSIKPPNNDDGTLSWIDLNLHDISPHPNLSVFLATGRVPASQPYPVESDLEDYRLACRERLTYSPADQERISDFLRAEIQRVNNYFKAVNDLRKEQWREKAIEESSVLKRLYTGATPVEKQGLNLLVRCVREKVQMERLMDILDGQRVSKSLLTKIFFMHLAGVVGWEKVFQDSYGAQIANNNQSATKALIGKQDLAIALAVSGQPVRFVSGYQKNPQPHGILLSPLSVGPAGQEWLVDRRVVEPATFSCLHEVYEKYRYSLENEIHENKSLRYRGLISILIVNSQVEREAVEAVYKNLPFTAKIIAYYDEGDRCETSLNAEGDVPWPRLDYVSRLGIPDKEVEAVLGCGTRRAWPGIVT